MDTPRPTGPTELGLGSELELLLWPGRCYFPVLLGIRHEREEVPQPSFPLQLQAPGPWA